MPETLYLKLDAVDVRPLEDGLLGIFNNESADERRYWRLGRTTSSLSRRDGGATCGKISAAATG